MFVFVQLLLITISAVASTTTVYDQRQSGKTNVRVELKDAFIIAVGDGGFGGDYDYNYDYSDLTIKPSSPTESTTVPSKTTSTTTSITPKSTTTKATLGVSSSTANPNIIQNATVLLEAENNSIIFPANNIKPGNGSTAPIKVKPESYKPDQIPVLVLQETHRPNKFLPVKTVEKQEVPIQNSFDKMNPSTIIAKELPVRHCSPGFFLDDHNRCKRIRRPTRERPQLPIGLRFDHKPPARS